LWPTGHNRSQKEPASDRLWPVGHNFLYIIFWMVLAEILEFVYKRPVTSLLPSLLFDSFVHPKPSNPILSHSSSTSSNLAQFFPKSWPALLNLRNWLQFFRVRFWGRRHCDSIVAKVWTPVLVILSGCVAAGDGGVGMVVLAENSSTSAVQTWQGRSGN